jgi:transcriptional regulator with XRE-family HTH domain
METGMRLKLFRVSAGLKQRQVAEALGVTSDFVSMIERGKREPTIQYLKRFARLAKIPTSVLLWDPMETEANGAKVHDLHARVAALMAEYAAFVGIKH